MSKLPEERVNDCFDRYEQAVIEKQNDLKARGINSWLVPLDIGDFNLANECLIEFHRRTIEAWKLNCPHKVWCKRIANFRSDGRLEMLRKRYLPDDEEHLSEGEFWYFEFLKGGKWESNYPPHVNLDHLEGACSVWKGGTSSNSVQFLTTIRKHYLDLTDEVEISYLDSKTGKIENETIHSASCEECLDRVRQSGNLTASTTTRRASEARYVVSHLDSALEVLAQFTGEHHDLLARSFEEMFHAGSYGHYADNHKNFITGADYLRNENEVKKGPRKEWTRTVADCYRDDRTLKWVAVLQVLVDDGLVFCLDDKGIACAPQDARTIGFEDGVTKDKDRRKFQKAINKIKKSLST